MASIPWGERPLLTRSAYFSTQLINPVLPLTFTIDKLKDYSVDGASMKLLNEHRDFLVLYAHHLRTLQVEFPDFQSALVTTGYPSNCEYHEALSNLKAHAEKLKTESEEAWKKY